MSVEVTSTVIDRALFEARLLPLLDAQPEVLRSALLEIVPAERRTPELRAYVEEVDSSEELHELLFAELFPRSSGETSLDLGKWRFPGKLAEFTRDAGSAASERSRESADAGEEPNPDGETAPSDAPDEYEAFSAIADALDEWHESPWSFGETGVVVGTPEVTAKIAAQVPALTLRTSPELSWTELDDAGEAERFLAWFRTVDVTRHLVVFAGHWPRALADHLDDLRLDAESSPPEPPPSSNRIVEPASALPVRSPEPHVLLGPGAVPHKCEHCHTHYLSKILATTSLGQPALGACPQCGRYPEESEHALRASRTNVIKSIALATAALAVIVLGLSLGAPAHDQGTLVSAAIAAALVSAGLFAWRSRLLSQPTPPVPNSTVAITEEQWRAYTRGS